MNQIVRIYYEVYEQANYFIKPMIRYGCPNLNVKLVCFKKSNNGIKNDTGIAKILQFKNPDIIISYIQDNKEVPLFVIEFSEAVMTEDHELQRFDGHLGAAAGNCFYIKISPNKQSAREHGGNIHFNTLEPYVLIYKRFKLPSFFFDWPLRNDGLIKRDLEYLSCPPQNKNLEFLIIQTIQIIEKNFTQIDKKRLSEIVIPALKQNKILSRWLQVLQTTCLPQTYQQYHSARIAWSQKKDVLYFKFNRMGHAMDPERGMIWFFKYRCNKPIISKIIFPSTGDSVFQKIILKNNIDYLNAFIIGMGMNTNNCFTNFLIKKQYLKNKQLVKNTINLTEYLQQYSDILNKPLFAIFANSQSFLIQDKTGKTRIKLYWHYKFELFKLKPNFTPAHIIQKNFLSEDDITYIVAHQVLKPNGFKLLSVSYPGAQGDRAILPQAGTGRQQQRKYIDIIACYPKKYIDLTENKGEYVLNAIKRDIDKLYAYKTDINLKKALNHLVYKISPQYFELPLLLSVGFWLKNAKTDLKGLSIHKLNFFIIITPDRKKWKIWTGGNLNIFKKKEGDVNLEKTYYISKIIKSNTTLPLIF